MYQSKLVACKLTDFGESRSLLILTQTVMMAGSSHTKIKEGQMGCTGDCRGHAAQVLLHRGKMKAADGEAGF